MNLIEQPPQILSRVAEGDQRTFYMRNAFCDPVASDILACLFRAAHRGSPILWRGDSAVRIIGRDG